jgi:tape measure domain-containing protein
MSSVEERVVSMKFDGDQFLAGVDKSLSALDKLNSKLKMSDGTKGLNDIGAAADGQSSKFGALGNAVEGIAGKFKTLSVIGISALATITTRAVDAGLNIAKALTLDPIKAGFQNYETQIKAVQTILANTQAEGTKIGDVNKVLAQLNTYANQTVYNFSQMAQNIGTFTAAGVKLKPAAEAIKGIANLAALSGSSSEQASTAMYQLSQAIAAGRVSLQDWNSVVNAGLGGKTFQNALVNTARASGVAIDSLIKKSGSFRNSLQKGWLTSSILTKTLSQFTGDLSKKQLESMGFSAKQAADILVVGKTAVDAATKIKTMSQLTDALKEEVATAWSAIFKTIFGNIGQATDLFSKIHTVAENALTKPINDLNLVLEGWSKLGGRTAIIKAIENAFTALGSVMKPIGQAFREIFPPATAKELASISFAIEKFTASLKVSSSTAGEIKRTFAGLFAVLDIGWQVIKQVGKVLFDLIGVATKGSGGFLNFTAGVGDFLVELDKSIKKGQGFADFFKNMEKFLVGPINLVRQLDGYIGHLFDGLQGLSGTKVADKLVGGLKPLAALGNLVGNSWSKIGAIFSAVWKVAEPIAKKIGAAFSNIGKVISGLFSGLNFNDILKSINTGLFAGLVLLFRKFVNKFKGGGVGSGLFDSIKESFEQLTGTLSQMQKVLKATTLLEIATAVGILAIALIALSKIDIQGLARALGAITIMFGQLIAAMSLLQKFTAGKGAVKLPIIAAGLILLAAAVDVLANAVVKLSGLNWEQLAKGLTGLTGILGVLIATVHLLPNGKSMISASLGMIAMAAAVKILVSAVTQLSGLSWQQMAKGLVGVAGLLGSLAIFSKLFEADKAGIVSGAGILLLAAAMKVLASALGDLASMSWTELGKGLGAMAVGLGLIAAALNLVPPSSILSAAAILVVAASLKLIGDALAAMGDMSWSAIAKSLVELAGALGIIAGAMALMTGALPGAAALLVVALSLGKLASAMVVMGGMSWTEIAKSLVELAGSLLIITAAMVGMTEALPGAAALLVVAASLAILAPVLVVLGQMTWGEIVKGLVTLAGALAVIGVAAALLTPVIPSIIGLGVGVGLLGVAMAAAGIGVAAFGVGLTLIAASGAAAAGALVAIVTTLLGAVPQIVDLIGALLKSLLNLVINTAPLLGKAAVVLITTLLDAVNTVAPKIINTVGNLMVRFLGALEKYEPSLVTVGLRLVTGLLNGMASRIGGVVAAASNLAVAFLNAIGKNGPRITDAGVKMVINLVNGLAKAIRSNTGAMQAAGRNLALAIIDGMTGGLASGIGRVVQQARNIASSALSAAKGILGIHSPSKEFEKIGNYVNDGFVKGLDGNKSQIDSAFSTLKGYITSAMQDSAKDVQTLTDKLEKLQKARHKDNTEIRETKAAIKEANKEHAAEVKAYAQVNSALNNSHTKLGALANQYDALTAKINTANDALTNAIKTRDDFNAQISQQFDTATAPTSDQTATDYLAQLKQQVADTNSFANDLQALRKLGLNDHAYQQLLEGGTAELPFVQSLLQGGQDSINQLNLLQKQLDDVSSSMGKTASTALYQAAVNSAQGLVDGLKKQQAAIEAQMDTIAAAMVKSIKKALGIKSPSRVFKEVGDFAGQGLVKGLDGSADVVGKSAAAIGNAAVTSMQKSLANTSKMTLAEIDVNPTIRPVLDLTDVKKGAGQISNTLAKATISTSGALANANTVSAAVGSGRNMGDNGSGGNPSSVTFIQNNNSPKAISAADTYRQTKNQLSVAKKKGALG